MLTREQKDQLENLLEMPEVETIYIRSTKDVNGFRQGVAIHLKKGFDLIPVEEAVGRILTTLEIKHRGPIERDSEILYTADISTAEKVGVDLYAGRDKEELA